MARKVVVLTEEMVQAYDLKRAINLEQSKKSHRQDQLSSLRLAPRISVGKNLFPLPNGKPNAFAIASDLEGPSSWWRTEDRVSYRTIRASEKTRSLRLGFWNSGTHQFILCADFDLKHLPVGYGGFCSLERYSMKLTGRVGKASQCARSAVALRHSLSPNSMKM